MANLKEKDGILMFRKFHANIKIKLICSFFNRFATRTVLPFMALYFSDEIGKVLTGFLLTLNIILQFLSSLIGGYLADRYPRKKILLIGQLSNAISYLGMTIFLYPLINKVSGVIIFFMLSAIVGSLHKSAMDAIIIDSTTKDNRKSIYTFDYWLYNVSLSLGMVIGGLFYVKYRFELFTMLTIILFATTYIYQVFIDDKEDELNHLYNKETNISIKDMLLNYFLAAKDKKWLSFVVGGICIFSAELSLGNYIGVRLAEEFIPMKIFNFQLDGIKMMSLLVITNTILAVTLTFIVSNMIKKFNQRKVFLIGILINVIGYGVLAISNQWLVLMFFITIATIGELIYSPIRQVLQVELIPRDKRASYLALGSFSIQGASILASLGITIGTFLQSMTMSLIIVLIGGLGMLLSYFAVYSNAKQVENIKESVN
ncbi:MFS transporter [Bacillus thuringiensis]|uniref:MFS transporter n=1 Tax=Bacillus thuringiensis TaxID=1428 RepID=UPI00403DAD66